jgi:hypothetical protein
MPMRLQNLAPNRRKVLNISGSWPPYRIQARIRLRALQQTSALIMPL